MDYMARALALAAQAQGRTSPNPMVGAVLVKEGRVVGEGFHARAGGPHAEVVALAQAGPEARGATLYVTLEPCNHHGRTPPCTQALIQAGVAEVHMAMLDPNPKVSGRGRAALEAAGIRTVVGEREAEARALNEIFVHWVTTGRPFVWAKYAMTLDGKIATVTGHARWISGPEARRYVHELRDRLDAILVGANTVLQDDPQLTTRLAKEDVAHPLRVILDSRGRIPLSARVFEPELPGQTLVATTEAMPRAHRQALEAQGVQVWSLPECRGKVNLVALLARLGQEEITSVLVEGGGTVLGALFAHGLVDKVTAIVAPQIVGGRGAPTPVGDPGVATMDRAWRLTDLEVRHLGPDVALIGYPDPAECSGPDPRPRRLRPEGPGDEPGRPRGDNIA